MFSVDNFYAAMRYRYDYHCSDHENLIVKFIRNGDKNITNLHIFGGNEENFDNFSNYHCGKIFFHDQEPLFFSAGEEYRKYWIKNKLSIKDDPDTCSNIAKIATYSDLLHLRLRSGTIPIVCHSERNSKEIDNLVSNDFVDCYYWWHGLISQDWYRHWRWHHLLNIKNKSSQHRFLLYARGKSGTRKYRRKLIDFIQPYLSSIHYNHNSSQLPASLSAQISIDDSNISHMQIVAETLFDTEKIHLTEKVFKPIVMSQAFLLFGPPGSLRYMRSYGFRTFGSIWDESYDDEKDHNKRMTTLFNLIEKILNLDHGDYTLLCEKTLPIIKHNRSLFFSDRFQEHLVKEMFDNFDIALQVQKEKSHAFPAGTWIHVMDKLTKRSKSVPESWRNHIQNALANLRKQKPDRFYLAQEKYSDLLQKI